MQTSAIKGTLKIKTGDAALPEAAGHRIIIQFVSDSGKYSGDSITNRWNKLTSEYKRWYLGRQKFSLGNIQEVAVQSDTAIVQAIVLKDTALQQKALQEAFKKIADLAQYYKSSVIMNKITDGWDLIEGALKVLLKGGINVTIYEK